MLALNHANIMSEFSNSYDYLFVASFQDKLILGSMLLTT